MRDSTPLGLRMLLIVVFGAFALPELIYGAYLLVCWVRIHLTTVYYVEYPYFAAAIILIAFAAFSLFCTVYGALQRSFFGLIFAIPLVLGLATMVFIPDAIP